MKKKLVYVMCLFLFLFVGINSNAQKSGKVYFGSYPADYEIAYFSIVGYKKAPTIRVLFGPNVVLASSFQGVPATVIIESATGNKNKFTGTLLLSAEIPDTGELKKIMRLQVTFQSNSLSEKSYVRHVKVANLISGRISEQISNGSEFQDGKVFGFFEGSMKYFWDVTKFQ